MGRNPIADLEFTHMKDKSHKVYIACETLDFKWDEREIPAIENMWKSGMGVDFIADTYKTQPEEVAVLLMDLAMKNRIKPRRTGVWGRFRREAAAE